MSLCRGFIGNKGRLLATARTGGRRARKATHESKIILGFIGFSSWPQADGSWAV
jgi:hypothetical protein